MALSILCIQLELEADASPEYRTQNMSDKIGSANETRNQE